MKSEDDPEARIRELERSLTDQAQASELGTGRASSGAAYLPPPVSGYSAPNYGSPPQYGTEPFGTQPYGTPYTAPRAKDLRGHSVEGVRIDRGRLSGHRGGLQRLHVEDVRNHGTT